MFGTTCLDLWRKEAEQLKIVTFLSKSMDDSLGGGIPCGIITEFCGAPGSGKTQLCLKLCVNVQLPAELGGIGGAAIYIDTNLGFNAFRFQEVASASIDHFRTIFPSVNLRQFRVETVLDNVSYVHCRDHLELIAAVKLLEDIIQTKGNIKLIVVDSFSFHFRNFENTIDRTRIIYEVLTELQVLADRYDIAVVLTNEVTTRFNAKSSFVCPALGDSQTHKVGQRIFLKEESVPGGGVSKRFAYMEKVFGSNGVSVPFTIDGRTRRRT